MAQQKTISSSRARAGAPLALAAACGLALAAPAAGQLSEPFPAVFDLETLTAAAGGDGSLGFVVRPQAGHSVASAGDVNGDGVDDVVIGARSASWVVFGQKGGGFAPEISAAALDGSNGFRMVGGGAGFSVSSAGDMNADGVSDVLVAGTGGEAFVVFGRATGFSAEVDLTALDGRDGVRVLIPSGAVVSTGAAGDVNDDGVDDIILGIAGDLIRSSSGQAYVVFGRAGGFEADTINAAGLDGEDGFKMPHGSRLGVAVAGAGDINGDGIDDIVLGAPGNYEQITQGYGCGCFDSGAAYVVFGRRAFPADVHLSLLAGDDGFYIGGFSGGFTGASVAPAGDFNDDGLGDLMVSAPYAATAGVIFGRDTTGGATFPLIVDLSTLDVTTGVRLQGVHALSVAGAGDVNGDGVSDVIVGTPYHYTSSGGLGGSYVVYGRATLPDSIQLEDLDGEDGFHFDGAGGSWQLGVDANGEGVASAGDVNGDGVADVILAGASDRPAYIIFGRNPDAPCYADCDASGGLDFFDFLCFQNQFAAGDPRADCDESGLLDFFDFLCFQNAFAAGCP